MIRRSALLVLVIALLTAACGSTSSETTSADGDATSPSVTVRPGGSIEGPAAPDFTIALGADGAESFTLSDGATPVYMVFWAEW